jgi:hypothetical protein
MQDYSMKGAFVKSPKAAFSVIPEKAGIQEQQELLDPGDPVPAKAGSRGDDFKDFSRVHQEGPLRNCKRRV